MSEANMETESRKEKDIVELVDCGQASRMTRGFPFLISFEQSWPPFDRQFLF